LAWAKEIVSRRTSRLPPPLGLSTATTSGPWRRLGSVGRRPALAASAPAHVLLDAPERRLEALAGDRLDQEVQAWTSKASTAASGGR
jgi:hypothetical protein